MKVTPRRCWVASPRTVPPFRKRFHAAFPDECYTREDTKSSLRRRPEILPRPRNLDNVPKTRGTWGPPDQLEFAEASPLRRGYDRDRRFSAKVDPDHALHTTLTIAAEIDA